MSRGLLDEAKRLGRHNVELLRRTGKGEPIVFLEPACYSMFIDEYRQFGLPGAEEVAGRCRLFEDLIFEIVETDPEELDCYSEYEDKEDEDWKLLRRSARIENAGS